jgi:hypothetical protein
VKLPWCCESDVFPPGLTQTTVAVYVAVSVSVALVLPTPARVKPVQLTPLESAEQLSVPDFK